MPVRKLDRRDARRAGRRVVSRLLVIVLAGAVVIAPAPAIASDAPGVDIDGGAPWTASPAVTVLLDTDGAEPAEVRLSNSGTMVDGVLADGVTLPWAAGVDWSLDTAPCPCGDGDRTVWAQWRADGEPWSAAGSDTILLDTTGPTGSVVIDGDAPTFGDPWNWRDHTYTFPAVTLTVAVEDAGPALPPTAWAVSRDGVAWEEHPLTAYGSFDWPYELVWMDVDEGVKTVWVRFRDALGNWSEPVTDTIVLRYEQAGQVIVGDGSGYVDGLVVPVRVPVDVMPPEGIATVWLSSEYLGCAHPPYGKECAARSFAWEPDMVIPWDLRDPDYYGSDRTGHRRVIAWWVSTTGRTSNMSGDRFIVDRDPPVSGPPRPIIEKQSTVGEGATPSTVTAIIRWSTSSNGSPVASNRLQQRTGDGSWSNVPLAEPTSTSATRTLAPRTDYRFRARSVDTAGNVSDWAAGPTFTIRAVPQDSDAIRYEGGWRTREQADALGGTVAIARTKGARATLRFTGRGIAVVAPRSDSGGEMKVYVDGRLVRSAYLFADTDQPRRVVFTISWAKPGTHTISIVKKWEDPDYPIALDAFLVLR